jgi:hypothetical protein
VSRRKPRHNRRRQRPPKCFEPVKALPARAKDLTGQRFGKLRVLEFAELDFRSQVLWRCSCECGRSTVVAARYLARGSTTSCGCAIDRHGHWRGGVRSPTWSSWSAMRDRCRRSGHSHYARYGGRGVRVCERWERFSAFLEDMGSRPEGMTLDRWPNRDGDYEPGNVRWATPRDQCRNNGKNRFLTHSGETRCIAEWAERTGIGHGTIRERLKRGWSVSDALTRPLQRGRRAAA